MKRLRFARVTAVSAAIALAVPATAAPANSAPTYTRSYSSVQEFYSSPLKRCLRFTLWGKVTFGIAGIGVAGSIYTNVKLTDPTMRLSVLAKCGTSKSSTLTKVSIAQRWYAKLCSASVQVQGGYPWSIGVTPTVDCGNKKVGTRKSTYGTKAKYYTQYNSGTPLKFDGRFSYKGGSGKTYPLCLRVKSTTTSYIKSKSDSWTITQSICVKK